MGVFQNIKSNFSTMTISGEMDEYGSDITLVEVNSEPKITAWNRLTEPKISKNPFCKVFPLILNRIYSKEVSNFSHFTHLALACQVTTVTSFETAGRSSCSEHLDPSL